MSNSLLETQGEIKSDTGQNTIIEQICRSCLVPIDDKFFWMASDYLDKKFIDIYKNVTSIEVDLSDKKPNKVCLACYNTIIKFENFKEKTLESEKLLSGPLFATEPDHKSEFIFVQVENGEKESGCLNVKSEEVEKVLIKNEEDDLTQTNEEVQKLKKNCQSMRRQRVIRKVVCKDCGKHISIHKLNVHLKTHTKKHFSCQDCGESFTQQADLFRHMQNKHSYKKDYKCKMCNEEFQNPLDVKEHEKTSHINEETALCSICAKTFKNKARLSVHMKGVHGNDNFKAKGTGFQCNLCGNIYKYKSNLYMHQKTHDHPKPFLCTICGKKYSTKAVLQNHQKIHTGEKNYECPHCQKKFRFVSTFRTHLMIHKGEKPLSCPICDKSFRQHSHLKTHIRGQHTGSRPFECSFCQKTFKHSCNLTVHTRIHTGETPYVCDICLRGFYDSSSLKKHRKSHCQKKVLEDRQAYKVLMLDEDSLCE